MALYYLGWFASRKNDQSRSISYFKKASSQNPDYCFPNRIESVPALENAALLNPDDSKCHYYLGNFWYANRQFEEAIACWEKSIKMNGEFPTVHRNLSLAFFNKTAESEKALNQIEKAFDLDQTDARILFELDQLYKRINRPVNDRLKFLAKHPDQVNQRDDLYLEQVILLNLSSEYKKALELIMERKFHPIYGGEGRVSGQYLVCHVELAKQAVLVKKFDLAIEHLRATEKYPYNLSEGKLHGAKENDINYWFGIAFQGLGDINMANLYWEKAAEGHNEPAPAKFYYDQPPDKIFYQGLALVMLDRKVEARNRFNMILDYGYTHMPDDVGIDYFAISLPDLLIWETDLRKKNTIHCNYMIGLGNLGLGKPDKALEKFQDILNMENHHLGAHIHKKLIEEFKDIVKIYITKF